ncbi:hypothetical protein BaRGS_00017144 [Batillaria attramentaria]|uniref:Uncharacterized protein n=1 Tax=Batillaria attramentaria TaxID=370345 RepID=A0ABD0KXD3_9CAEN
MTGTSHWIALALTMTGVLTTVRGDCYYSASNGRQSYCMTNGEIIPDGYTLNTKDCYRCSCNGGSLDCCRYGMYGDTAETADVPPGCTVVENEKCNYIFTDSSTGGPCLY